jgi:hypothetical protein
MPASATTTALSSATPADSCTHHHITTTPHHHITTSPHHHITTSPHHHTVSECTQWLSRFPHHHHHHHHHHHQVAVMIRAAVVLAPWQSPCYHRNHT